mmetsp:Transcript_23760/g.41861  ORF Transcript_23760/g.41861 Transcript_23760/m.41861 type:complete len:208 (-) Transcript_23760:457-1080(-)
MRDQNAPYERPPTQTPKYKSTSRLPPSSRACAAPMPTTAAPMKTGRGTRKRSASEPAPATIRPRQLHTDARETSTSEVFFACTAPSPSAEPRCASTIVFRLFSITSPPPVPANTATNTSQKLMVIAVCSSEASATESVGASRISPARVDVAASGVMAHARPDTAGFSASSAPSWAGSNACSALVAPFQLMHGRKAATTTTAASTPAE